MARAGDFSWKYEGAFSEKMSTGFMMLSVPGFCVSQMRRNNSGRRRKSRITRTQKDDEGSSRQNMIDIGSRCLSLWATTVQFTGALIVSPRPIIIKAMCRSLSKALLPSTTVTPGPPSCCVAQVTSRPTDGDGQTMQRHRPTIPNLRSGQAAHFTRWSNESVHVVRNYATLNNSGSLRTPGG